MPEIVASPALDWQNRILNVVKTMQTQWFTLGALVDECKRERYFEDLGFASFDAWAKSPEVRGLLGKHRSTLFDSRKLYRELSESNVKPEDMQLISRANAKKLTMIPENHRAKPEIVKQAQNLTEKQFSDAMGRQFKSWMPDDPKVRWGFNTVQSRADRLDELLESAMGEMEIEDHEKPWALEKVLTHFVECRCKEEDNGD